ncbi:MULTISPECIES: hypothetical protein [unclassified Methylocaldum]|jgi:hypothetical protein|uniref:transmembrane-type terpene cyclase n=1 Tax=unclassified Methylocaldum TaxID=2622260 RepID=UPI00098ABBAD|nr:MULTISPECIES: hypothetical protein [unclassified Methylocaldum]MBP1152219.1 hypothetical protein [Methylocaldum sp. RMAD-M]
MSPTEQLVYNVSSIACLGLWGVAYLLIIRRAFKDRAYGMPLLPLCTNLSYEFIFAFLLPDDPPLNYANGIWFLIDLVIAYQYLRFGRKEFPSALPQRWFLPAFGLALVTAFAGILAITFEFQDWHGNYTGWGDQLLISVSFPYLLVRRQSVKGQSVYIALSRMIGSIALIPAQYVLTPDSLFLAYVYIAFIVFDLLYIALYLRRCRSDGINPWRRL